MTMRSRPADDDSERTATMSSPGWDRAHLQPAAQPSGGRLLAPSEVASVRRAASRQRAECTLRVALGEITVWDVLRDASRPGGRALLRISLRQLLLSRPKVGAVRAQEVIDRTFALLGDTAQRPTVQWLIDPRAQGRRILAFLDATRDLPDGPPWPGFPFAPHPGTAEHDGPGETGTTLHHAA